MHSPISSGFFVIGFDSCGSGVAQMMHDAFGLFRDENGLTCGNAVLEILAEKRLFISTLGSVVPDVLAELCFGAIAMAASTVSRRAVQSIVVAVMTPLRRKARCLAKGEDIFGA
jgi:hypothetical protein